MAKKNKIKLYEVSPDSLVYAISLVESPAIESNFIYLSEEKPVRVCLETDEKHLVYGAVLIPDKPIYRNDSEEYYIQFPKETIENLAHNYLKDDNVYSFTKHHNSEADGISIVESWVKLSENDKSVDLGLDVPVGTWLIGAKVENEEVWEGIKRGEMKGFSVESFLNFNEIMMSKQEKEMSKEMLETINVDESFWTKIVEVIKDALRNPEVSDAEAAATSEQVVADIKEEVNAEEKVDETIVNEEQMVEEPIVEEPVVEEPIKTDESPEAIAQDVVEEVVENTVTEEDAKNDLQLVIDELNKKIDELNSQIEELKRENQKLSKQPSVKPVNTKSENFGSQSNFDRMLSIMNGSAFRK